MKRLLLTGTLLFVVLGFFTVAAHAQITSDHTGSAASTVQGTTLTWSHTVGSSANRILVVGVAMRIDTSSGPGPTTRVTGVTFNGTALTCLAALADNNSGACNTAGTGSASSGFGRAEIWYLLNPAAATANIVVTVNNSTVIAAGSASYFGVTSVTSGGTKGSNNGVTGSSSISLGPITTPANGLVVDTVGSARSVTDSATGTGHTDLTDAGDTATAGFHIRCDVGQDTTSNPTLTWTLSGSSPWAIVAAVLTPAPVKRKTHVIVGSLLWDSMPFIAAAK
jgi:hypothetical protein